MNMPDWTTEQQNAINDRGHNLLVSAAAGSGKTAVMIERVFSLIVSGEASLDRMLIVTYTNAAAASMRKKLVTRLDNAIADDSNEAIRDMLKKQRRLVERAHISTVHAYCIQLLRRYYFRTKLPPDFRMIDDAEAKNICDRAMKTVLEEASERCERGEFPEYEETVFQFSSECQDDALEGAIRALDKQLSHLSDKDAFKETVMNAYSDQTGEKYRKYLCGYLSMRFRIMAEYAENLEKEFAADPKAGEILPFAEIWKNHFLDACSEDSIEHIAEKIRLEAKKIPSAAPALFRKSAKVLKDFNDGVNALFEDDTVCDMTFLRGAVKGLFELQQSYDEKCEETMLAEGGTTFDGVLRYTAELLNENPDILADISNGIDYIFVDEYQDINERTDELVKILAQNRDIMFFVGDVKQSIYGFMQSRPQLFTDKMREYDKGTLGKRINLKNNFRSFGAVLEGANFIFGNTMFEDVTEIEYDDAARLCPSPDKDSPQYKPGIKNKNTEEPASELLIVEGKYSDECEAIALRIKELTEKCTLTDAKTGKERPVTYGDIVILGRTNKIGAAFEDAFRHHGIPYMQNSTETDVNGSNPLFSVLKLLVKRRSDPDLIRAMLQCNEGFTEAELASVRIAHPEGSFYDALIAFGEEPLKTKISSFFEMLDRFRCLGRSMPLPELIDHIYNETGYIYRVACMQDSARQLAKTEKLIASARRYINSGRSGLKGFLEYYESIEDSDGSPAASDVGNTVRFMTMHKSKGLEFPIVIITKCAMSINSGQNDDKLYFNKNEGLSFRAYRINDEGARVKCRTVADLAMKERKSAENAAENLRLLYVAITRAQNKFIIAASSKTKIKEWCCIPDKATVANYNSFAKLVVPFVCMHKDGYPLREYAGYTEGAYRYTESSWKVTVVKADDLNNCSHGDNGIAEIKNANENEDSENSEAQVNKLRKKAYLTHIQRAFRWKYKYIAAVSQRTKQSPSKQSIRSRMRIALPEFENKEYKGAQKGTVVHFFMEHAVFDGTPAQTQADRMLAEGFLSNDEYNALPIESIQKFFDSPLGQRMKNADIFRERSFCLVIPFDDAGDDSLVQGIIDCYFFEGDRIVLLDYKTDFIHGDLDEHIKHHTPQLKMYKDALERLYPQKKVIPYIHFFSVNKTVEIM